MKVQKAAKNRIVVCAAGFAVILTAVFSSSDFVRRERSRSK